MKVAVVGGTGTVGAHVVAAARVAGHEPVVLARSRGIDVTTGVGLDDALRGVTAVIDVANLSTTSARASVAFFEAATRHLLAAESRAVVSHHVVLSIVGIDRVDLGYYRGKCRQEELVVAGGVPSTILRATQFHEFAAQLLGRGGPVALVPRMKSQPIAAHEVAAALVDAATAAPVGRAPELAGPQVHDMPDLVRQLARARGQRRPVIAVPVPGKAGKALAAGDLLPTSPGPRGTQTFAQWLSESASLTNR
jgi:uncharacterized protein YbjT (DUF2867 family)